jgi:hypothetical protein
MDEEQHIEVEINDALDVVYLIGELARLLAEANGIEVKAKTKTKPRLPRRAKAAATA